MRWSTLASWSTIVFAVALPVAAQQPAPAAPPELKDLKQRASYAIGVRIGTNIKSDGLDVDLDMIARGIRDSAGEGKPVLTEEQLSAALNEFQQQLAAKQQQAMAAAADKNKKDGEAFLAANKGKEGVKTLPSGLQYKVVKAGTGAMPKATDEVTTHYRGTLIDGTEFDSSYSRGQPATFGVGQVIRGWTEALQLMKVGDKWELYIPSDMAYGPEGRQPAIPPHATLIFEVELLKIEGK